MLLPSEYARHAGVNRATVTKWTRRGMPLHDGRVDPAEADAWRRANVDRSKPRAKLPAGTDAPETEEEIRVVLPDGTTTNVDQIPDFATSQKAKEFWSAERVKRDVQKHDREHVPVADVLAATGAVVGMLRGQIMGLPRRLAATLEGKTVQERHELIRAECHALLTDFADRMAAVAREGFTTDPGAIPHAE